MADHATATVSTKGYRPLYGLRVRVVHVHDTTARFEQRPKHVCARRSDPDNGDVAHRRSVPVTSRQPSVCGGTPPVPRMRNRAATIPVIDSAATTRRTNMNMGRP